MLNLDSYFDCDDDVRSGYGVSSAAYSQPVSQPSGSYAVGQQQTAQYGPYGNHIQVCVCVNVMFNYKKIWLCTEWLMIRWEFSLEQKTEVVV